MQRLVFFYFCLSSYFLNILQGQNDNLILEKRLTFQVIDISTAEVLKSITKQSGVLFSYNSSVFNDSRKLKFNFKQTPLRLVLDAILKGTNHVYKLKKNYIIIYLDSEQKEKVQSTFKFSGYVYDGKDSSSLENVSIYIKQHKQSSISNQFGYFVVQYPKPKPSKTITISIAKENYADTVIVLDSDLKQNIKIYLKSRTVPSSRLSYQQVTIFDTIKTPLLIPYQDSARNGFIQNWLGLKRFRQNLRNINDTLFSKFSLSFVPLISTNKLLSINTINNTSFNLLVGYSKGTRIAEIGGILNIDNGSVQYFQAAGVGNVVSDSIIGVQASGVFNIVNRGVRGIQMAGLFNTVLNLKGVQLAGIFNHCRYGIGFQSSGIFNKAKQFDGMQTSGFFNISNAINGVQLAGVLNQSDSISGAQISGFLNMAKKVKGIQLSVINIADTVDGIPIGLFSYVKKGYHCLELSTNELLITSLGFRTGVRRFHNIFSLGSNISGVNSFLAVGYGFGSLLPLKGKWSWSVDVLTQGLYNYKLNDMGTSSMAKCSIGLEYKINEGIAIALAPSFNLTSHLISKTAYLSALDAISPSAFYNRNLDNGLNIRMWIGFNTAIRLF